MHKDMLIIIIIIIIIDYLYSILTIALLPQNIY